MGLAIGPRDAWLLFAALPYWYGTNAVSKSDGTDTFGMPRDIPHGFISLTCAFPIDSLSYNSFVHYLSLVIIGDITAPPGRGYTHTIVGAGSLLPHNAPLQANPLLNKIF